LRLGSNYWLQNEYERETDIHTKGNKTLNVTEIAPARFGFDWKEFWKHRELLYFLTVRDIKVRYKQTAIGVFWVLLQPLLTTIILTLVFSSFARFDSIGVSYPIFVLCGTILWLFVHTAITVTSNSFVGNTNLVTKIYFPRLIVPVASTMACVMDLFLSLPFVAILLFYYRVEITWQIALAPLFLFLVFVLAASFGILFSALNVRFRDVKFAVPFFLQVWLLASPIFYPASMIPEKWRLIFALNPLVGIIEGWRSSVFGSTFDLSLIGISSLSLLVLVIVSFTVFRSMEDDFADLI